MDAPTQEEALTRAVPWLLALVGGGGGLWSALKTIFGVMPAIAAADHAAAVADNKAKVAHDRLDAMEKLVTGKDGLFALAERMKGIDDYARETRLVGLHNTRNELGDRLSRLEEWKDDHGGHGA